MVESIIQSINNICEQMMIDPRFVLGCNFLLAFILKGTNFTTRQKKFISMGVMLSIATFVWLFFEVSGQKLFWSIPTALLFYDYFLKSLIKKVKRYIESDISKEDNDDIEKLDSVG